jgi:uncharacterized protein with beta-barrel porin domain
MTYTILQSTGGVSGPGFASVIDNVAMLEFVLVYKTNSIELLVQRQSSFDAGIAVTDNQSSIAVALDSLAFVATGDMSTVLDELSLLLPTDQALAMEQMGGELHGTMTSVGLQTSSHTLQLLRRKIRNSTPQSGYSLAGAMPTQNAMFSQETIRPVSYVDPMYDSGYTYQPFQPTSWEGWVMGYGLIGTAPSDGNATGADYNLGGTLFGISRWFDTQSMFGFYGGYGHSSVSTLVPDQSANVDNFQFGGYFHQRIGNGYLLATLGLGIDDYSTERIIAFGGINRVAEASYAGQQILASVEAGISREWYGVEVTPFAALQYIYLHQDDFIETGADALNLDVEDITTHSLRGLIGAEAKRFFQVPGGPCIDGRLHGFLMHGFNDEAGMIQARFQTANSPALDVQGLDLGQSWGVIGCGVDIQPQSNIPMTVNYDVQFNGSHTLHIVNGGLQIQF